MELSYYVGIILKNPNVVIDSIYRYLARKVKSLCGIPGLISFATG